MGKQRGTQGHGDYGQGADEVRADLEGLAGVQRVFGVRGGAHFPPSH